MTTTRRHIRVFIASPSDLAEERKAAKRVVDEINLQLAPTFDCHVELVGWEDTLPGVGRPQAIINQDLEGCDLFVGMLWKRWGTEPGEAPYTSGFEEEFERSKEKNAREGKPEISLIFKSVDPETRLDPGDQLKKVIAFKDRVIAEKKMLVSAFAELREFESILRRCIQQYMIKVWNEHKAAASQRPIESGGSPNPMTPLSVEGVSFLKAFLATTENATNHNAFAADAVARFRLLAAIASTPANDHQVLGAHDANLLFKSRNAIQFGKREVSGLVNSGLAQLREENQPVWHWIALADGFDGDELAFRTIVGDTNTRVGALRAMRLLEQPIAKKGPLTRDILLTLWLGEESEAAIRLCALEYLSCCGQLSDLSKIRQEFDRNDSQTSSAAAEAIIRIESRDDRRAALNTLFALQPTEVSSELLKSLFDRESEFDDATLVVGLSHRNASVRCAITRLLRNRGKLGKEFTDTLLRDSDLEVRLEALLALSSSDACMPIDQAEKILIPMSQEKRPLAFPDVVQSRGRAALEQYSRIYFDRQSVGFLKELAKPLSLDLAAYFALARRRFARRGNELRRAIENRFVEHFERMLSEHVEHFGLQSALLDSLRSLEDYLRTSFTRQGLDIICDKCHATDLSLVRSTLNSDHTYYSVNALRFLRKHGQWCDISLVITFAESRYDSRPTALPIESSGMKRQETARTLYSIGRHRLGDLLTTPMPPKLLSSVLTLLSDKEFRGLDNKLIEELMLTEIEDLRKLVALKFAAAFNRLHVKEFLDGYLAREKYYYNVVHWLDLGLSVPTARLPRVLRNART